MHQTNNRDCVRGPELNTIIIDVMEQRPKKHTISGDLKEGAQSKDGTTDSRRTTGIFGAEFVAPRSSFSFYRLANSAGDSVDGCSIGPSSSLSVGGDASPVDRLSIFVGSAVAGFAGSLSEDGSHTVGAVDSPGIWAKKEASGPPHYRFNCPRSHRVDYGTSYLFVPRTMSELNGIKRDVQRNKFMEMNYQCCENCLCYVCGVTANECPQWKWNQCLTNVTCNVVGARFCNDEPHCQNQSFPCGMSGIPHCYANLNNGEWRFRWESVKSDFQKTKLAGAFKIAMPSMEKWNANTTSLFKRHPRNMCMEKKFRNVDITQYTIDSDGKNIILNAASCELCCCIICDELASKCSQWDYHRAVKNNGPKKIEIRDLQSLPHCLATDLGRCGGIWHVLRDLAAAKKKLEEECKAAEEKQLEQARLAADERHKEEECKAAEEK